jgi:hypothetical protein
MAAVMTRDERAAFREQGYVVIPGALAAGQLEAGRKLVAAMLESEPPEQGHAGPYFLWPRFPAAGHGLDFYRSGGIGSLAAALLRPDPAA